MMHDQKNIYLWMLTSSKILHVLIMVLLFSLILVNHFVRK